MKKMFGILFLMVNITSFGSYEPWNYNYTSVSVFQGNNSADGYGESIDDRYVEFEGFHRYNLLDMYWFVDFFDAFDSGSSDVHGQDPNLYGEINPRISLDGLLGKDLSFGNFKEWFISYQYDFDDSSYGGGLKRHQIGIGNDVYIKGFDYVRMNLLARYHKEAYDGSIEDKWDGYLLNAAYGRKLHTFKNGWNIYFSGWVDYVFGANESKDKTDWSGNNIGTDHSLQWFNQLKLQMKYIDLSYSYKINDSFTEVKKSSYNSSDSNQHILGVHYVF
ncbi:nucleoside-specific channel-forming protein Tsx [Ilyobacter polytropus]|uniref:Nucleoside-specific channel-forming protein, Tsx n=1 Tax=Ilyobacter polytropus (strain ATCC 51220 / DSM 2926 / LMG 16218 / CuHBu1) TaxID=572544 RepID=E3HAU2_ILYPC|nr:nucleoside-specific channel-forming protein Tsx [Ilyobacter polytropus]ADO82093.1 Nucleoside-specific channel-forming protein, Tsx [Ilyobacter polytropus DSM 2926]